MGHLPCRTAVWKSGIFGTFWLPALDPDNRLRYPPVSLLRDMCWWLWLGRGVPEQFLEVRFVLLKLGFVVQKLHGPEILKMQKFCFHIAFPAQFRYFSGPAGGRSLRARVPFLVGI